MKDLEEYLTSEWGPPDILKTGSRGSLTDKSIKGSKGMLMMDTTGAWSDASGHFTLWDGSKTKDKTESYIKESITLKL